MGSWLGVCLVTTLIDTSPNQTRREEPSSAGLEARQLMRELSAFKTPRISRSSWELASTLLPFVTLFAVMLFAVDAGYYWALALAPVTGLLLLRLFIIQHDCGHGAFLPGRKGNDWVGRAMGVLTLTPYDCWARSHAIHHASTGNLDARGYGDVDTLTVQEYADSPRLKRWFYRFYRSPAVLLGLGPAYLFLLRHRLPIGLMKAGWIYWIAAMGTNLVTAIILGSLVYAFSFATVAMIFLPVLLIAASTGVWLFYVQHQFEHGHWDKDAEWSFHDAALMGSSHLELPAVLRWFTGNIGIHHVHHLASRVPFYRLPEVLRTFPELHDLNRFTMRDTFSMMRLALWDESQRRLVSFREAKQLARASA